MTVRGSGRGGSFGGVWTNRKLDCLQAYLATYLTVMKNRRDKFRLVYIDAFAGAGRRYADRAQADADSDQASLLSIPRPETAFFDGSAKIAMRLEPGFDHLVFVDDDPRNVEKLENLKGDDHRVIVEKADANAAIQKYCRQGNWRGQRTGKASRGVIFLDPFGMQVTWSTIQAIAETGALDMWYLFPSGLGANRMTPRDRTRMPQEWEARLDTCTGTSEWRSAWYRKDTTDTLFGQRENEIKVADIDAIEAFFLERLRTIFPCVASKALAISNSRGYKMFSLCFAAGVHPQKGGNTALRVAEHLLDPERQKHRGS